MAYEIRCSNCGALIGQAGRFCQSCGAQMMATPVAVKKPFRWVRAAVWTGGILGSILASIIILGRAIESNQHDLADQKSMLADALRSKEGMLVPVARDRKRFSILSNTAADHAWLTETPVSQEDLNDKKKSPRMARTQRNFEAFNRELKTGGIVRITDNTRCKILTREKFETDDGPYDGTQIRVLEGPRAGFEGWTAPMYIGKSRPAVANGGAVK